MIFFFYGPDAFRARQKIDEIKDKFHQQIDPAGHNVHYLNDQDFQLEKFFNLVNNQGFLAAKKLIIIKDLWQVPDFKTYEPAILAWLQRQKNSRDENYLIIWQTGQLPAASQLAKKLKSLQYAQAFEQLTDRQLQTWLQYQAKQLGVSLTGEALNLLQALVGQDTWQLYLELHKLAHQGQTTISLDQVRQSVTAKTSDSIFQLIDACASHNKKLAHSLINEQLANGVEPLYLLAMIIRQFRLIIKAKDLLQRAKNSYALSASLKLPPFVAKKLLAQAQTYSPAELRRIYALLSDLDWWLKNSSHDKRAAFTLLVEKV